MQTTMGHMSGQLNEKWNDLPKNKKIQIGIGVVAFIMTIIIASIVFTRPNMTLLYNQNLETKQVAEIVEVLDARKLQYKIVHNGMNIEVDKKQLEEVKVALATENVPKGDYNFSDAINNTMTTTESEKKEKFNRLKEVELERMLISMDDISNADVTLVIPEEKNSFLASKQKSSASVLLTLDRPQTTKQIEGMARLISSSVTNLDIENINIVDTEGNALYLGMDEGILTGNKQQELKLSAENDIKSKIIQLLDPIFDEVRISPNLILDFDQYEEIREEYIPQTTGKGLPSVEQTQSSTTTNTANGKEPGVATNGGDATIYALDDGSTGESKSNSKVTEYANNKVVSNAVKNVGTIDYKNSSLAINVFSEKVYKQDIIEKTLDNTMTWDSYKETNKMNMPISVDNEIIEAVKNGTGIDNVVINGYEKP
ncbi:MAG: flagellar basal-body MS-ring/collar protein FliF, partial [Cellulosilyticaceae bacterium]